MAALHRSPQLTATLQVRSLLRDFPVVAVLGPRQVGKTTLAKQVATEFSGPVHHYDLERAADRQALADPQLALEDKTGLVVLDEVQRTPELFPTLRVLADRPRTPARFLVLGSASPALLRQSSETLAGRIAHFHLRGFSLEELGPAALPRLWLRGGFPRSYLARSEATSATWREEFVTTFLERDLPQLSIGPQGPQMRRFWTMLAHLHGQIWNASDVARSLAVTSVTTRKYLDRLAATFVVTVLQPFHANLKKRQVKSPKVYIADSGLLHTLLGIQDHVDLQGHPKSGASWEGFALHAIVERLSARPHECFFWATHAGAELDLVIVRGRRRVGFEFKLGSAPELTPSLRTALQDLGLERIHVIHGGKDTYRLAPTIDAVPLRELATLPAL